MENRFQHILLATDALSASNSATETALQLARQNDARVTIVDAVREPSQISRWLTPNASEVFEMVVADKQQRIQQLTHRFREAGVNADGEVLFGKSSEAITRAAVHLGADLVVRYMKGVHSRFPGVFGNTARNLMRVCPCPILFVGDSPVTNPNVLACVNCEHDVAENQSIADAAEALASDADHVQGVYFWDLLGKDVMKHHVSEKAMSQLIEESAGLHQDCFDSMQEKLQLNKLANRIEISNGDPAVAIVQYCVDKQIDVVVMCSASLNHPIQRFLGSTTEAILEDLPCALLVVKPRGFKTHVAIGEASASNH